MSDARPAAGAARWLARLRSRPAPAESRTIADPARVERLLILKPHDQLGDFLLATPAFRALRERFPRARIALVTREFLAPLATRNHDVDVVWTLPRIRDARDAWRWLEVVTQVARFHPDVVFVLNSVSRSKSADSLAVLARPKLVVGRSRVFAGELRAGLPEDPWAAAVAQPARDPVYDLDLDASSRSQHQADRILDLVRWTGAEPSTRELRLDLDEHERAQGRARLAGVMEAAGLGGVATPVVGFHPGAANALKCWPLESFVGLGVAIASDDPPPLRLVVFDSPRERERGRAAGVVAGLAARGVAAGFVPAAGIESFAATCAALDLLVCNDSGVMHVAVALGVPTVSFHSLGKPSEWGPRNDHSVAFHAPGHIETIPVEPAAEAVRALLRLAPDRVMKPQA
jgi:ADP-heptose:LPS heptosyltransferase